MLEEQKEENPTYYSILPSSVRYDKTLKANEKILYSEITVLCNKKGYCYASNEYFANLYDVHKNTISVWINNLKNRGYIGTKIIYKNDDKTVDKRIIYLSEVILKEIAENYCERHKEGINEMIDRYISNHLDPINENSEENNTSINNNKNKKEKKSLFEIIEENYGRTLNGIEAEEIDGWNDTDLTRYVIKESILKGIRNIKYISRILEDYKLNDITTIEQAKQREKKFYQSKNDTQNNSSNQKPSKWDEVRKRVEEKRNNERRGSI